MLCIWSCNTYDDHVAGRGRSSALSEIEKSGMMGCIGTICFRRSTCRPQGGKGLSRVLHRRAKKGLKSSRHKIKEAQVLLHLCESNAHPDGVGTTQLHRPMERRREDSRLTVKLALSNRVDGVIISFTMVSRGGVSRELFIFIRGFCIYFIFIFFIM